MTRAQCRTVFVAAVAVVVVAAGTGTAAAADADGTNASAWQRYHAAPFTAAPGTLCTFGLRSDVVFDREYVRTTAVNADGSPRVQEFVGPLQVRLTNLTTHRAIVRDLSGRAVVTYRADGGFTYMMTGPVAVGFHPGDSLSPGYYVLRGNHTVRFAADGTRTVVVDDGTEENVCTTLSS